MLYPAASYRTRSKRDDVDCGCVLSNIVSNSEAVSRMTHPSSTKEPAIASSLLESDQGRGVESAAHGHRALLCVLHLSWVTCPSVPFETHELFWLHRPLLHVSSVQDCT